MVILGVWPHVIATHKIDVPVSKAKVCTFIVRFIPCDSFFLYISSIQKCFKCFLMSSPNRPAHREHRPSITLSLFKYSFQFFAPEFGCDALNAFGMLDNF